MPDAYRRERFLAELVFRTTRRTAISPFGISSIAPDTETLVPFIKAAQRHQPAVAVVGVTVEPTNLDEGVNRHYAGA